MASALATEVSRLSAVRHESHERYIIVEEAWLGRQLAEPSLEQRRPALDQPVLEQRREPVAPGAHRQELVRSIGREYERVQRTGLDFGQLARAIEPGSYPVSARSHSR